VPTGFSLSVTDVWPRPAPDARHRIPEGDALAAWIRTWPTDSLQAPAGWWRRRESNSRPKQRPARTLRA